MQDELNAELAELEQDVLDERLTGAESVPVTSPVSKVAPSKPPFLVKHKHQFYILLSAYKNRNSGRRRRRAITTTTSLTCNVDACVDYAFRPHLPSLTSMLARMAIYLGRSHIPAGRVSLLLLLLFTFTIN